MTNSTKLEDGIHIGLPMDAYLADNAMSSSDIKNLIVSPLTYWVNSHLNPNRPARKSTPAKEFGEMIHSIVLEGKKFNIAEKPEGMSFATKNGKAWKLDALENGATILTSDDARTMKTIIQAIDATGIGEEMSHGIAEVSFVWTDPTGHRNKIRLDKLCEAAAWDLKTFANTTDKDLETCIAFAVGNLRYHVVAYWYRMGLDRMLDGLRRGNFNLHFHDVTPDEANYARGIIEAVAMTEGHFPHHYVFLEKGGIPNIEAREFTPGDPGPLAHEYWRNAERGVHYATSTFATYSAEFEPGKMWARPVLKKEFSDEELGAARSIFTE